MGPEPNDGELGPIRLSSKLAVVYADEHNPLPEQGRSIQSKAGTVTTQQLLSRLFGRQRYQQSIKVPALEIQPSQPSTS